MNPFKNNQLSAFTEKSLQNLSLAGFSNITDLLDSYKFKSYTFISDLIKESFPMIIIHEQFAEAKKNNLLLQALKDCLARYLIEKLPRGWGIGDNAKWQSIRALTNWSTAVETAGDLPELSEILSRISHDMIQNPPPQGWSPETHGMDLLDLVFNKFLNEKIINSENGPAKKIQ